MSLVTGSIARSAKCPYLSYSEADFEVAPMALGVKFGMPKFHPIDTTIRV